LYDIRPGNGAGQFLQPGARTGHVNIKELEMKSVRLLDRLIKKNKIEFTLLCFVTAGQSAPNTLTARCTMANQMVNHLVKRRCVARDANPQ